MAPAELSAIQPRTCAAAAGGDDVGTQIELADRESAMQQTSMLASSALCRLFRMGFLFAILAGVLAWFIPMVWGVDPSSDSKVRAVAGFGVLLLEVFAFHGGLMLLAISIIAAVLGFRKNAVLLMVLAVIHAGPGLVSSVGGVRNAAVASETDAPMLTILSHNLLFSTANLDRFAAIVDKEKPDVIMLQEVVGVRARETTERFQDEYPYHIRPTRNSWGPMLLSRHPFIEIPEPILGHESWPIDQPVGVIDFAGRPVKVVSVHLPAPNRMSLLVAGPQMAQAFAGWIGRARSDAEPNPAMVFAGDFNAPLWTARMQPLMASGLVRAHDSAGDGRGATWPAKGILRYAPGIRLDQAASVGPLRCVESRVLGATGSDHRPILARFVWAEADGR